ncbi:hypothetical protein MBANPS3_008492 [Mucor bainieri]
MYTYGYNRFTQAIGDALSALPGRMVHPKLKLVKRCLESSNNRVPDTELSARLSFRRLLEKHPQRWPFIGLGPVETYMV